MPPGVRAVLLAVSLAGPAAAQVPASPPPFDPGKAALAARIEDPEAATRAYLDAVPAERRARTKAYATGNYALGLVDFAWSSLVSAALLGLGISARMRDRAQRLTRFRQLQVSGYWIQLLLLTSLVDFPLTVYRSYHREKAYGLLTQGFGDWMVDQAKGLGVGAVLGSLLLMLLYRVLRAAPRTWWIWGAAVMIGFVILGGAIAPVFIAPIFNKFTPVKDEAIRQDILAMARAQGVPADDVYEMDASRRTERISAYVSGMLGTTRVVMFDTTLKRCTPAEIRMIMGHEMGHYVLNHVWMGVAFFAAAILLGFWFVRWGYPRAAARWPAMGVAGIDDVAGLPLLSLLLGAFFFVSAPARASWTRYFESRADDFGLQASREPDAAATTFLKLGEYRDLEPHPAVEMLLYDHPSGRTRIRNAMEWKKAHLQAR